MQIFGDGRRLNFKSMLWCIIFIAYNVFKNKPFLRKDGIYFLGKISLAVYLKWNSHYFNLKLKYKVLFTYLFHNVARLLKNHNFNVCGRMVVANGSRNAKKLICSMEGEHVVAYGRLPSPASLNLL